MKIENYQFPKSSFLSIEKDLGLITDAFFKNNRLKKLLYYTTNDALEKPALTEAQTQEMFKNSIRIIPKLYIDDSVRNYIVITFDDFIPNPTNPEFRDNTIFFNIVCHLEQWKLKDFQLRPYKIAAEIDSMFDGKHLTGIGTLEFVQANQIFVNDDLAGVCLMYKTIHGEEDKKFMPNPIDEAQFLKDFKDYVSQ